MYYQLIDFLLSQKHKVLHLVFTKDDIEDLFECTLSDDAWTDCVRSYRKYAINEYTTETLSWCMPGWGVYNV